MSSSYNDIKKTPGTAEFLKTLLTEPDHSCPHSEKIKPGIRSKIPKRLGFFHAYDEELSYLDTRKLCKDCYNKAVPEGFSTWSTFYFRPGVANPTIEQPEYLSGEPTQGCELYFPRQLQAGTEKFDEYHGSDGQLPGDVREYTSNYPQRSFQKALDRLGHINYDGIHYERRSVGMPQNPETVEAWKYMKWARKPFYIDLLHVDPPWRGNLPPKEQMKQDRRIAHDNGAAYIGAQWVVTGVPEGGTGPYTTSEHRIAELGSYRLLPIGQYRQDEGNDGAHGQSSRRSSSNTAGVQLSKVVPMSEPTSKVLEEAKEQQRVTWEAREVDSRYYGPDLGKGYFKPGSFQYYPDSKVVDKVTKDAIGRKLKPTKDEKLRRQYESELPKIDNNRDPAIFLKEQTSPPQDDTLHSSRSIGFLQRLGFGRQSRTPSASTSVPFAPTPPYSTNDLETVASAPNSIPKESPAPRRPFREADLDQPYRIPVMFSKASSGSAARRYKVNPEGQLISMQHGNEYKSNVYAKKPFRRHKPVPGETYFGLNRDETGPWEQGFMTDDEEEGLETRMRHITQKESKVEVKTSRPERYKMGSGSMPRYEEWQRSQRAAVESKREEGRERQGYGHRNDLGPRPGNPGSSSSKSGKDHSKHSRESGSATPSGNQDSASIARHRYPEKSSYSVNERTRNEAHSQHGRRRANELSSDYMGPASSHRPSTTLANHQASSSSQRQSEPETSSRRQRKPDMSLSGNKEGQKRAPEKSNW